VKRAAKGERVNVSLVLSKTLHSALVKAAAKDRRSLHEEALFLIEEGLRSRS